MVRLMCWVLVYIIFNILHDDNHTLLAAIVLGFFIGYLLFLIFECESEHT